MTVQGFEERLRALDPGLFEHAPSQTSREDRVSLLALHNACREVYGTFRYLEIGSHLGGSLQVLLVDERCTAVTSIDLRPVSYSDARFGEVTHPDNTAERMRDHLSAVPGADLTKLRTIEASTKQLSAAALEDPPQLCFIDGEHTDDAALADARYCRQILGGDGAIAFHDFRRVRGGIIEFVAELDRGAFTAYRLELSILVVELGQARLAGSDWIASQAPAPVPWIENLPL